MKDWLKRLLTFKPEEAAPPVAPGLYHIMHETDRGFMRFHLRVENDGTGMLIANAMAAAQLTSTGVLIAKALLEGQSEGQIRSELRHHYSGTDAEVMHADIEGIRSLIAQIEAPGDTYPVFNLEDAATSPYSSALIAPLQAALPLVEAGEAIAFDTLAPILDRLWEVGIPHAVFLTLPRFDPTVLVRAVERAEDIGMIAGARGRASELADERFLADLKQAGIDHVTFLYAATDPLVHDALCGEGDLAAAKRLLAWLEAHQISAVAEIPLVQVTLDRLEETVAALLDGGADNLLFVAYPTTDAALAEEEDLFTAAGMAQVATTVEETASLAQARFMWGPPVARDPSLTLSEQVIAGPRCSGDVSVRITPAGEVIPPRGSAHSAGNLLRDSWESIWNDPVFQRYRERVEAPTRCEVCPDLTICAADCPRDPQGWVQS
jgi:radical SAM protein with 4Fe4S-binding SPASM domain